MFRVLDVWMEQVFYPGLEEGKFESALKAEKWVCPYEGEIMITKSGTGYKVKSESGKNLSKVLPSKKAAVKRLAQVEMFKHMKEKK